jgi:hypothetical protein
MEQNDVGDGVGGNETPMPPTRAAQSSDVGDIGARMRPPRIRNLSGLMLRENVDFVIIVGGAQRVCVDAEFESGKDTKSFGVGDDVGGGCFVLMHLQDNPEGVGVGFFDLRPPRERINA